MPSDGLEGLIADRVLQLAGIGGCGLWLARNLPAPGRYLCQGMGFLAGGSKSQFACEAAPGI